jgi:Bacterial Ig-like domain (group 3)
LVELIIADTSGTTKFAKVQLVNGTASVSTAKRAAGTHAITAEYSGDCCDYLPASVSISQVVNK